MSEVKHTPGPWRFSGYKVYAKDFGVEEVVISETLHYPILLVTLPTKDAINYIETVKANTRLIAAAPDMFNALIDAKKHLEEYCFGDNQDRTDVYNNIVKAINKATGN